MSEYVHGKNRFEWIPLRQSSYFYICFLLLAFVSISNVRTLLFFSISGLHITTKRTSDLSVYAVPKFSRELGRVSNFNQPINWHHHMKDHVETGHLTKYDAFRVNRDRVLYSCQNVALINQWYLVRWNLTMPDSLWPGRWVGLLLGNSISQSMMAIKSGLHHWDHRLLKLCWECYQGMIPQSTQGQLQPLPLWHTSFLNRAIHNDEHWIL